ncbi:MAG: hypothetical protein D6730_22800 [Bacteroidetes bacterium]|nr:MAG: hypothetical protein D6730_22800 [Bacteroidota bacterium]
MIRAINKHIRQSPFFIRLLHWEYWPMNLVYTPVYLYWLYLAIRSRALLFFSAANPGIETGGLYGDAKIDILNLIPTAYKPRTCHVGRNKSKAEIRQLLQQYGIGYPLIAKPNVGERGFWVEKIDDEAGLWHYLRSHPQVDLLVQEYVHYPEEVSVLYYRFPGEQRGHISSLTLKKFLSVTGDGHSTLRQLITAYPRARLQLAVLEQRLGSCMEEVLPRGETRQLVPIGNHSRGTTFLDGCHLIDERLLAVFDRISQQLPGIYFGRFDIRCQSLEALKQGRDFRILEINGVKSEPTHIYQPGFSLLEAYRILFRQWRIIYQLSMANNRRGVPFMKAKTGLKKYWRWYKYKRNGKFVTESPAV